MKRLLILLFALALLATVPALAAAGEAAAPTPVYAAIAAIIAAVIGAASERIAWIRHVAGLATVAYEYAEQEGIAKGLIGYDKLHPFMKSFAEEYRQQHDEAPSPAAKAVAVKVMEEKVAGEHLGE